MKILYTKQIDRASILKTIEKTIPIIRRFWGDHVSVCHGGITKVDDDQQKSETIEIADLMKKN